MTFDVQTRGRRRTIDVQRSGNERQVVLDGRTIAVSVSAIGDRWSILVGTRSYEVALDRRSNGPRIVYVNGQSVPVSIGDLRTRAGSTTSSRAPRATGTGTITAPMPGRVVKVLVNVGDDVVARQGVLVIEAMKMENELRAPRSGRVTEVRVTEGMSVEANTILIVIE